MENNSLLDVQHLSHMFHLKRKMTVKAIDDVSFQIKKRGNLRLVGNLDQENLQWHAVL